MSNLPTQHTNAIGPNVGAEVINSSATELTRLSNGPSMLTRIRTHRFKNRQDLHVAKEKVMVESEAGLRIHKKAVGYQEDYMSKLMLAEAIRRDTAIENDIVNTKNESDQNSLYDVDSREVAAYATEQARMDEVQAMFANGQISEPRFRQYLARRAAITDELIQGVYRTNQQIKDHRNHRFTSALQRHRGS